MALSDLLSRKKEVPYSEHFWALVIESDWVEAAIWTVEDEKVKIVSLGPSTAWKTDEELVAAVDTALSASIQDLSEEISDPTKTVFGVPSSWSTEGEIKKEYLEKIKEVCAKLSLSPTGFVVIPEAISHYVKATEGSPLTGVALGLEEKYIEVSVFRLGKLVGTTQVARSISVAEDVAEGLARYKNDEPFPSRFLLYDGKESETEETRQMLLKADWDTFEELQFLHTPKIELVDLSTKVTAVALAGATELSGVKSVYQEEQHGEEKEVEKPESSGFVVGEDVSEKHSGLENEDEVEVKEEAFQKETGLKKPQETFLSKSPKLSLGPLRGLFASAGRKVLNFAGGFNAKLAGGARGGKKLFTAIVILFVMLLVLGFTAWWYLPKSTVVIFVSPKRLTEALTIFMDLGAQSLDVGSRTLPAERVSLSVSGEKTKSTTGTKTVGERASGEVTFYRSGAEVEIPAGTEIVGPNSLRFSLNEGVTVASGSASSPGKAKAAVSALDIGAESNLAAGTSFKVGSFSTSSLEAINEADFSGGSSREIQAVSDEDQSGLITELTDELIAEAQEKLKDNLKEDDYFIEESVGVIDSTASFSNEVGEEADSVKLNLDLEVVGFFVKKEALFALVKEVLKDKIPAGFILRENQLVLTFELIGEEDDVFEYDSDVVVNLLPEIIPEEIAAKIKGKYLSVAIDYLSTIPGFSRAEIRIKPTLPGRLKTLPHMTKNITVEIAAEK